MGCKIEVKHAQNPRRITQTLLNRTATVGCAFNLGQQLLGWDKAGIKAEGRLNLSPSFLRTHAGGESSFRGSSVGSRHFDEGFAAISAYSAFSHPPLCATVTFEVAGPAFLEDFFGGLNAKI